MTDPLIAQMKQAKKVANAFYVDGQKMHYPVQDLGAGIPCFTFQDHNSNDVLIFAYLPNLDDFYVDDELIVPFQRTDGKKANFIYYKIPTPENSTFKFFSPNKDAEFIIKKVEEHDIL